MNETIENVLKEVVSTLQTVRGEFYPDKNYGSNLKNINKMPFDFYALTFAKQALYDKKGIYVKSANVKNNTYEFNILFNGEERQVLIDI